MELEGAFFRDTWAEIDLDAIFYNVAEMKKRLEPKSKVFAVVKANGYGHGAFQIAQTALEAGAEYLAVAFLDEAIQLRQKGIGAPILVLGAVRFTDLEMAVKNNITVTMFDLDWLKKASSFLNGEHSLKVHVKLDTGMGRIGLREKKELIEVENILSENQNIVVEGVFTHFATADELNTIYMEKQLQRFRELLSYFSEKPAIIHCSNSASSLLHPDLQYNAIRMGISMYGLTPSQEIEQSLPFPLKESFSLHTRIVQVKKLQKGEKVSYGATYEAMEDEWIGTLPIGYADGWLRKLSGQEVLVNGERVPIIGRICMDQCMIKLQSYTEPGTKVTLIGKQDFGKISVNEIAAKLKTINYEVTCSISNRVPRLYRKEGIYVEVVNPLV
ncbi:alanine racemase [Niallia sp. NCCP-28]|uniref:alanine racemase n=1 Tax=Niallia sp. NCCP-28 TaxID=2934712 RepID=UPI00208C96B2|nr:alanine racemase [Niallia sp. NCCP-28]GKU84644.1 alanine racemase 1 [Niallia sp. NCCP-28]